MTLLLALLKPYTCVLRRVSGTTVIAKNKSLLRNDVLLR